MHSQPALHCRKRETEAEEDFSGKVPTQAGGQSELLGRRGEGPGVGGQGVGAQAQGLGRGEKKGRAKRKQDLWVPQLPRPVCTTLSDTYGVNG